MEDRGQRRWKGSAVERGAPPLPEEEAQGLPRATGTPAAGRVHADGTCQDAAWAFPLRAAVGGRGRRGHCHAGDAARAGGGNHRALHGGGGGNRGGRGRATGERARGEREGCPSQEVEDQPSSQDKPLFRSPSAVKSHSYRILMHRRNASTLLPLGPGKRDQNADIFIPSAISGIRICLKTPWQRRG